MKKLFKSVIVFNVCGALPAYLCMFMQYAWRPEEDTVSLPSGVCISCDPPCRCWELSLGPWEERAVLLTTGPSI